MKPYNLIKCKTILRVQDVLITGMQKKGLTELFRVRRSEVKELGGYRNKSYLHTNKKLSLLKIFPNYDFSQIV